MFVIQRFSWVVFLLFFAIVGVMFLPLGVATRLPGATAQARANMQRVAAACRRAKEEGTPMTADDARQMLRGMAWPKGDVSYSYELCDVAPPHWVLFACPRVRKGWLDRVHFWMPDDPLPQLSFSTGSLDQGVKGDPLTDPAFLGETAQVVPQVGFAQRDGKRIVEYFPESKGVVPRISPTAAPEMQNGRRRWSANVHLGNRDPMACGGRGPEANWELSAQEFNRGSP